MFSIQISTLTALAAGISVDAGLTPSEDRWIFRTQLRYMERNDDPGPMDRQMERYVWNNVLAYGLKRNLTLIVRQPIIRQEMSMVGSTRRNTGRGDLFLAAKYGIYRRNTADYTFGIAGTLGLELPTGEDAFSSDTWDLKPGVYMSVRNREWASDLSVTYLWNGIFGENSAGINPGEELSLDWALARQFSLGGSAEKSLSPVVELSYRDISSNRRNGNDIS
ncbi:MAG: transporter, partial [Flavobacteriales bacterium]|nr:transporter [Flavobacteriales bacterium]